MSSAKKPQPVTRLTLDTGYGGMIPDPSGRYIRHSDHEATIEALRAERDEARKDIEAFWKPQFDEQVERAETAEVALARAMEALAKIDKAITAGITETNAPARIKAPGDTRIEDGWIVGQFAIQFDLAMKGVRSIARALLSDGGERA